MSTDERCEACQLDDQADSLLRNQVAWYDAVELHDRNERGWGVVGAPHGALAEGANGSLLMKLTEREARAIAEAMSARLDGVADRPLAIAV